MSNPIVRYAIARENGFFKVEQVRSSTQALTAELAMPANSITSLVAGLSVG